MPRSRETWRPRFHIAPAHGRINDPNGLLLDGERFHVFYQTDPYFPEMDKRTGWGHASVAFTPEGSATPRLKGEWRYHPDALVPNHSYDRDGCYTGCAVRDDHNRIHLIYTGNVRDDGHGRRHPTQNLVDVGTLHGRHGGLFRRNPANPLIDGVPAGYTGHVRDPHVTRDPATDGMGYRMVLGAQTTDETPAVLLYTSPDLTRWTYRGPLTFDTTTAVAGDAPDIIPAGYMWECPNLIRMRDLATGEDLDVLIICPQGLEPRAHHYASSDQCGYIVGRLDGTTFHVTRGFTELDMGHEFYAPQVVGSRYTSEPGAPEHTKTVALDAILVAWLGLPAADQQPTVEDGWVHVLSMPRRLRLVNGRLTQQFITTDDIAGDINQDVIFSGLMPADDVYGAAVIGRAELPARRSRARLSLTSEDGITIPIDLMRNRAGDLLIRVDRSQQTYHDGADVRGVMIWSAAIEDYREHCGNPELRVFADGSVLEISVAGYTLSSRVFLDRGDNWISLD